MPVSAGMTTVLLLRTSKLGHLRQPSGGAKECRGYKYMSLIQTIGVLNYAVKYLYLIGLAVFLATSITVSSCKNTLGPTTGQNDIVFPSSNVSFYKQVLPLFDVSCDYSGCHDDQTQAGNLALTSYAGVISAVGVVIPKDTLHSLLFQRIKGINGIMPPPPASPLNSNQINGIKQWILEGAPAN